MPLRRGRTGASSTSWTASVPSVRSFIRAGYTRSVAALVDQAVRLDPRHHRAQLLTHLLDRVLGRQTTARLQRRRTGTVLEDEVLSVLAGLDVAQRLAHRLLGGVGDDLRTGDVLAVLGVVRDRVVHVRHAAFVDQ